MGCPCKDCERKGCGPYHDQCTQYKEWSEQRRKVIEALREERKFMRKRKPAPIGKNSLDNITHEWYNRMYRR